MNCMLLCSFIASVPLCVFVSSPGPLGVPRSAWPACSFWSCLTQVLSSLVEHTELASRFTITAALLHMAAALLDKCSTGARSSHLLLPAPQDIMPTVGAVRAIYEHASKCDDARSIQELALHVMCQLAAAVFRYSCPVFNSGMWTWLVGVLWGST